MHKLKMILLMMLAAIHLNGCIAANIFESGHIHEQMEPQHIVVGKDGTVAVKVKCSYFRYGFINGVSNDFLWRRPPLDKYQLNNRIPLRQYKLRDRYLIVNRPFIEWAIKHTSQTAAGLIHVDKISLFDPGAHMAKLPFYDITIIPDDLLAPSLNETQLPGSLCPPNAVQYKLNEPVPYMNNSQRIYLTFDQVKIHSGRDKTRWWTYPATAPFFVAEFAVVLPVATVLSVLTVLPEVIPTPGDSMLPG